MPPSRRGARSEPRLTTIYWRDIPAQVSAKAGRERASVKLDHRFQVAIDGAATRAGKTSADEYLGEWREESTSCGNDLQSEVNRRKEELERQFTPSLLREYVRAGGLAPDPSSGSP